MGEDGHGDGGVGGKLLGCGREGLGIEVGWGRVDEVAHGVHGLRNDAGSGDGVTDDRDLGEHGDVARGQFRLLGL